MNRTAAIVQTAATLDRLDRALAAGDRDQADQLAALAAVRWTVAEAYGATTADVKAHRAA